MENTEIARIFNEIADLLEIKGENPFRIRSYRNAGLVIEGLPLSLATIVERGDRLEDIPGIGTSIKEKILEILRTGRCRFHEELLKEIPSSLLDLLKISGVGPRKVSLLYRRLGIKTVDELERAAKEGRLHGLPGFGEKTEKKILRAIDEFRAMSGRFRLSVAHSCAVGYVEYMKELKGIIDVVPAGSLRRWKDSIGDVDILVTCRKNTPVMDHFVSYPEVKEVVAKGETKSTVILKMGLQVDLRVLERRSFGSALQYFTGSKAHNIALRERARRMGLKISEYGVFREKDNTWICGRDEEEVYRTVGLEWLPRELREKTGEIEAAEAGGLPCLVDTSAIRGDLHVHTKESDGMNTPEEIATAGIERGYEYIAITDHSKAVGIAHGLDEKRLLKEMAEIDRVNERLKKRGERFRLLKGVEVDIRADGSLDISADILSRLDCVVGAIHSGFNMSKEDMTRRIVKAIRSGFIDILAHPTGRIIGTREPYQLDMEGIMEEARRYGVSLELNSYPDRLDLNDINCKLARERGIPVTISTDSHGIFHLNNIIYGIHTARRGWLEEKDVLNTRPLREVLKIIKKRRRQ